MKNIALHLLDICQNSFEAHADTLLIRISDCKNGKLNFCIKDNGKGMDEKRLLQATDPFYTTRTTRKVGMGLSLLKQNCEKSNGGFYIQSKLGKGTLLKFYFNKKNIDCLPLGDLSGVLTSLLCQDEKVNTILDFKGLNNHFNISTKEIKELLEDIPLNVTKVHKVINGIISENIQIDNN